jgi:hypothetical protein
MFKESTATMLLQWQTTQSQAHVFYLYLLHKRKNPLSRLGFFESGTNLLQNLASAAMTE